MNPLSIFTATIFLCLFNESKSQNTAAFFYDSFDSLTNWETFTFSTRKKTTEFKIIAENENNYLQIKSDSSASGLICKTKFNPKKYPLLNWKWKVSNTIPNADGKTKEGDDYPLRLFVMFEKKSTKISFWQKIKKNAIKLVSGYNPPYKSLCYIWANSETDTTAYFSPYTGDVKIIPKQSGTEKCNQWIEEQTNIVEDYKKYFDEDLPAIACIAIMGDTDNTESQTLAYLEFIKIDSVY